MDTGVLFGRSLNLETLSLKSRVQRRKPVSRRPYRNRDGALDPQNDPDLPDVTGDCEVPERSASKRSSDRNWRNVLSPEVLVVFGFDFPEIPVLHLQILAVKTV